MTKFWRIGALTLFSCLLLTAGAAAQQAKLIALTFDDGPSPTYTPEVLDILEQKHVRATFFLVGKWLPGKNDILRREVDDGDQIANHTFDHPKLTDLTDQEVQKELSSTADALREHTGLQETFMVRPPYGARTPAMISKIKAPVILWSVDPAAGRQVWSQAMVKRTLAKASDGGIILLHDTTPANVKAVPGIIDALRRQGYEFVTVRELFRLKGVTPKDGVLYSRVVNAHPQDWDESALASHWAYSAISDMTARGLMDGDGTGWHPNRYLTRAQTVSILWRICGCPQASGTEKFSDTPRSTWYASAAAWAKSENVVSGETDGSFRPSLRVTREQLYVMVARLMASQGIKDEPDSGKKIVSYSDDDRIDSWAQESVGAVRRRGFSSANDVELFRPRDWVTRAEAAELLDWYLKNY